MALVKRGDKDIYHAVIYMGKGRPPHWQSLDTSDKDEAREAEIALRKRLRTDTVVEDSSMSWPHFCKKYLLI